MKSAYRSVDNDVVRQALLNRGHLILESCALNATSLHLPHHDAPEVSIIVVSYNAPELLAVTLTSLPAHLATIQSKCELIIIDNASDDRTRAFLQRLKGAHIHLLEQNVGFGPACNMGASLASGELLLFLNPDIEMAPGCIDALVACIRTRARVGAVGGRLVFPGGRLQEAGAGFINDAQLTHPYERGNPLPSAPEAMFRRPSGYVSGALLLVRRDLFSSLGGFDSVFSPAYFEDTDLCLRIWKSDYEVVYEPTALAFHFENATASSRDSVDALLDRNRMLFSARHADFIFSGVGSRMTDPLRARSFGLVRLNVLYVDDRVPHVDQGAGYPRGNQIVNALINLGYNVSIFPLHAGEEISSERYRDIPREVEIFGWPDSRSLIDLVGERQHFFDVLWVCRPHNISIVVKQFKENDALLRDSFRSVIFDAEALYAVRTYAEKLIDGEIVSKTSLDAAIRQEVLQYGDADKVVCVSERERALFEEHGAANTCVIGYQSASAPFDVSFDERDGVLFIGSLAKTSTPNIDSMLFFLTEIWPGVFKRINGSFCLRIAGRVDPALRPKLEQPGVELLGPVESTRELLRSSRVFIAPTRLASGIPLKVLEAIECGTPAVITPVLARQIGWQSGEGFIEADWLNPSDFAQAIEFLYTDVEAWNRVRASGLSKVKQLDRTGDIKYLVRDIVEPDLIDIIL